MEEKKPSLTEMTLKEHRFVKKLKLKSVTILFVLAANL